MASVIICPKCRQTLPLPQPAPEKVQCSGCGVLLKIGTPAKSAPSTSVPAPVPAPPAPAVAPPASSPPTSVVNSGGQLATAPLKTVAGLQVQDVLQVGGLGIVYLAYHPHLKHFRAVKRPQPRADVDNEVLLGRFRREIEVLGALDSKHVVRALDAGVDEQGPYLITEYLDGESLNRLVARHRRLPVAEACELIRQAALGLQAAHEGGLVHRDVKPSNLMLARAGASMARVVVIDWGLVKQGTEGATASRLTRLHSDLGTPDYMAPEQVADAHGVDIRADIYSLGVTLYHLLAGQPPFQGRSPEEKLRGQARETFPPLNLVRPDVPAGLLTVLEKMVAKVPAQRYASPGEVAAALQPFCSTEPHRLLALLAPVPAERAVPSDTKNLLEDETQLGGPPPAAVPVGPPPLPPSFTPTASLLQSLRAQWQRWPLPWVLGGAAGLVLLLLVVFLAFREGAPKATGPVQPVVVQPGGVQGQPLPRMPPPPKGPLLADGEPGLVKKMTGGGTAVWPVVFLPDGLRAVSRYGGGVSAWDLVDYVQRPAPWNVFNGYHYGGMLTSPDGKRIAASAHQTVELFDGKTYKKEDPPIGLFGLGTALAFSPDSQVLATAEREGQKGRIRFWTVNDRRVKNRPLEMEAPVISLAYSFDGRLLAASNGGLADLNIINSSDKKITLFRADDGTLVRELEGHPKAVSLVAFFADSKRLFSASPYDGTLRVWNVDEADRGNAGKEARKFIQAGASATHVKTLSEAKEPEFMISVAFWPWGRALTGHLNGSLLLWDLETGKELHHFKSPSSQSHAHPTALAFSPDGHHALAAYNDSCLYLYRLPPPRKN